MFDLPLPLRWVSRASDRWRERLAPIESERCLAAARHITRLDDLDDPGFLDRLDRCVESLRRVDLNLFGRRAVRTVVTWHLVNRLLGVDARRRHPEIEAAPIEAPIIVVGLFRTGTTFLHHVLAADTASRVGTTWEFCYPVGRTRDPLGDTRWRKRQTRITLALSRVVTPDVAAAHRVELDGYEEDFFLLGTDLALLTRLIAFGDWSYGWSVLGEDLDGAYRWHRLQLQMLQAQRAADRWLLKSPWHLWHLESLLRAYPDARIIHIHRDPVHAIASQCSLAHRLVGPVHRDLDVGALNSFWVDYSEAGLARGQRAKAQLPASRLYDVRLRDLRTEPGETIGAIYEQFGLPCDGALRARFDAAAAAEPPPPRRRDRHTPEQFGLDAAELRERFADYCDRFGV